MAYIFQALLANVSCLKTQNEMLTKWDLVGTTSAARYRYDQEFLPEEHKADSFLVDLLNSAAFLSQKQVYLVIVESTSYDHIFRMTHCLYMYSFMAHHNQYIYTLFHNIGLPNIIF